MSKILIADDSARVRQMVKDVVAGLASEVFEACDGSEAIALYAAKRPDWVLMDLRMTPLDGLHATAEIKTQFPDARVVMVSQYDEAELRTEAARAGACSYVLKENLHELPRILAGLEASALRSNQAPCPSDWKVLPERGRPPQNETGETP